MTETEKMDEETEIFNLCSQPECPRDVRFDCEILIDYNADLSKSKKEINPGMKEHVHKLLSLHFIENANKSQTSRKSKFRCTLCHGKPMGSIVDCILHLSGSSHQKLELLDQLNYTVQHIPQPSDEHCVSVGRTIYQIVGKHVMSDAEVRWRKLAVYSLNEDLNKWNIGTTLDLYGSSLTGLGFQDSDVNVSATIPESLTQPLESVESTQKFISFLKNHSKFGKLTICPVTQAAKLHLKNMKGTREMILSLKINQKSSVDTAKLFAKYVSLCPMLQPLVVALRLWAKMCKVDCREKEGFPPHVFVCMVIYFLQKEKILPVLDPTALSKNMSGDEEMQTNASTLSPSRLGSLWIQLLRFYSNEDFYASTVISISEDKKVTKEQSRWHDRKITIADPVNPTVNLSRKAMSNNRMCEYIVERLKYAFVYFGVPRTIRGPLYDGLMPTERKDICSPYVFHKFVSGLNFKTKDTLLDKIDIPKWNLASMAEEVRGANWSNSLKSGFGLESLKVRLFVGHQDRVSVLADDAPLLEHIFPDWLYQYKFDKDILGNGSEEEPPIICKGCNSKQHFVAECPMEVLPYTPPTSSKVSNATCGIFNEVLAKNFEENKLDQNDIAIRQSIISQIKLAVVRAFPDISLQLFGSSINGFGTNMSDVDISVEFSGDGNEKNEQALAKMARIRNILYRMPEFKIIYFARNARIPVVKFLHKSTCLEGDLSASNKLAIQNSHLLRMYAEIDSRVKIIGLFLKKLVKLCDISEASKGSLSSYGYTLMLIHFFQQLEVPILPVLHELPHDSSGSTCTEGWTVQYFSDMENLKQAWPALGKNRQSLCELWLGFLTYYTNVFNFEDYVITITQLKPLTRLSKFWLTGSLIAIEDPFVLSHNIGHSVSRKMSVHILKSFGKFYEIFHLNYDSSMLATHKGWLAYFTDPTLIRGGKPPVDWHTCYICHHAGHTAQECPEKIDKKRKNVDTDNDSPSKELNAKKASLEISNDGGLKNGGG